MKALLFRASFPNADVFPAFPVAQMPEHSPQFLFERRFGVDSVVIRQRYEIVKCLEIDFSYKSHPSCNEIFILSFHIQRNVSFGRFVAFEEWSHAFRYKAFSCRFRQFQTLGIELIKDLLFRRPNRFYGLWRRFVFFRRILCFLRFFGYIFERDLRFRCFNGGIIRFFFDGSYFFTVVRNRDDFFGFLWSFSVRVLCVGNSDIMTAVKIDFRFSVWHNITLLLRHGIDRL